MKARFKAFRWVRFLMAMVVTFVVVIVVGKAMAMPAATVAHSQSVAGAPAAAASSSQPSGAAANTDPGVLPSDKVVAAQSYYRQVDAIRTDTELVTAQIDNLKAHRELDQARSGVFKSDSSGQEQAATPFAQTPLMAPQVDMPAAEPRSPVVVQTSMIDGRWAASIRLPSGSYVGRARAGQSIPGVGKIVSISLNDVTVSNGRKISSLPFASDDAAAGGGAFSPARNGMTITPPIGIR